MRAFFTKETTYLFFEYFPVQGNHYCSWKLLNVFFILFMSFDSCEFFSLCSINLFSFISNHLTFLCPPAVLFSLHWQLFRHLKTVTVSPRTFLFSGIDIPGLSVSFNDTAQGLCTEIAILPVFVCLCPCWHLTSRRDLNSTKLNRAFTILCLGHFMQLKPTLIFYEAFHLFSMHFSHGLP